MFNLNYEIQNVPIMTILVTEGMDIVFAPHTQIYIKINIMYVTLERADETSYEELH